MMRLTALGFVLAASMAAASVHAQGFPRYPQGPMMQGQGRPAPQQGQGQPMPQRDMRGPADAARLSPDERRQLRRDIQDAGRDIYRPARQAPMGPRHNGRR